MRECELKQISHSDALHVNAKISTFKTIDNRERPSTAPRRIVTDNLTLIPLFRVDFDVVCDLYMDTDADVFEHTSESPYTDRDEVQEKVDTAKQQWGDESKFSYIIEYEGELIGKTYLRQRGDMACYTFGLWLQQDYWNQGISQERADALIHTAFYHLDAVMVTVGCVLENNRSRRSIEKYISRYGGSYMGNMALPERLYHQPDDEKEIVCHPEWVLPEKAFQTTHEGITSLIEGVEYDDIIFPE